MKVIILTSLFLVGLFLSGISYAAINSADVAGLWLFEEGTGTVAADSSGNGNNGKLNGDPKWITGKFGKALELNGDDFVSIPDSNSLDMTTQITIMLWVRSDKEMKDMWADRQVVIGKHFTEYELGIYMDGQIHTYTSNVINVDPFYDEGIMASMKEKIGDATWVVGKWYHVAWTLNGKHETAYVNGIVIGEVDKANANTKPGTNPLEIGERVGGTQPVTGAVDDVAVLRVALSAADIQSAMKTGMKGALGGPTAVNSAGKLATVWGDVK